MASPRNDLLNKAPHLPLTWFACLCFPCSAKGFQHHRMTNGAMNVEIGNPAYKIYEGDPDDDAGELLDSDFALDPDKVTGKGARTEVGRKARAGSF